MPYQPASLYSEIAPNLFMGGTDDNDVIHNAASGRRRTDLPFDSIVTMYAWAQPADWKVQEFRYGVPDAAIELIDLAAQPQDIRDVITETINTNAVPKAIDQVGIRLLKFCNLYDLKKITDSIQQYAEPFQAKYQKA
jgi:hypothetical protein